MRKFKSLPFTIYLMPSTKKQWNNFKQRYSRHSSKLQFSWRLNKNRFSLSRFPPALFRIYFHSKKKIFTFSLNGRSWVFVEFWLEKWESAKRIENILDKSQELTILNDRSSLWNEEQCVWADGKKQTNKVFLHLSFRLCFLFCIDVCFLFRWFCTPNNTKTNRMWANIEQFIQMKTLN